MHEVVNKLISVQKQIDKKNKKSKIIAVSKTFPIADIIPLIDHGHEHFGENKVQESIEKWTKIKSDYKSIKLHMIGRLQTNKVKYVLPLFDYIHSLDNIKLAEKIASEQDKINKKIKIFLQVNIGEEEQKSGVLLNNLDEFYLKCSKELNLDIIGLMCLPPISKNPDFYFSKMKILSEKLNLDDLSMGMSNDYLQAIDFGSTYVRIGSEIFGKRT